MSKYIHYCWFGGKPLPKLAKKCIKSWKKYLPDYEIIEWNENNVDLEECPFVKEAYENKKWAFVADYVRTKALYEKGGIYLDTDMKITKKIDFLLDKETFLGIEDSMMVNAAVWGAKSPRSYLAKKVLDFYKAQEHFKAENIYKISIPRIITRILNELNLDPTKEEIQVLYNDIYIYPRDYFYPLSYNRENNVFTNNTCMVHYFDATWIPKNEQIEMKLKRKFGAGKVDFALRVYGLLKRKAKRAVKLGLYPVALYGRYKKKINKKYLINLKVALEDIENVKEDYLVMHNPEWFGVTSATMELFASRVRCGELLRKKDINKVKKKILEKDVKQVVFSAMALGWKDLAIALKEADKDIKIKVFWHGSHSQVSEPYGWQRNLEIIELHKQGMIDVFATCKENILDFYRNEGYKTMLVRNTVRLPEKIKGKAPKNITRVGLYAAKSDDWRKNMFAQLAAVSLISNVVVDMVPLNPEAKVFADSIGLKLEGLDRPVSRDELLKRMANNTINLYVTFSECAPMLPLESFEVGVPCITGNNHHYFKNHALEEYLVVKNEESPVEIVKYINKCLENKEMVMKTYKQWKKENDILSEKSVKDFLEM
ncbi:MAG: glycosyltransferase [Candidatus Saccharibacteria bacterium]|nr:glycosyltransferase [Candidatus Saccharibacteria bacterium]